MLFRSEKQLALVEMEIQRVLQLSPVPDTFTEAETETTLEEFNMEADLERYKTTTTEQLLAEIVGTVNVQVIPGMNEWEDRSGAWTPWDQDPEALSFFQSTSPHKQPIQLSWHQLVGVHKILGHMLKQESILLADAVGVGKTLQAITVIVTRMWFINFFTLHKHYPGPFREYSF